jgi:prolyl oligopeptidase
MRNRPAYPPARIADVVDVYHGTSVADPYRWLEDPDSPETVEWTQQQNALTFAYLGDVSARADIRARLSADWNRPGYSAPKKAGKRLFYSKNDGLQNQPVLSVQEDGAEPRVLLDPNTLSDDGTVALIDKFFNQDGTLMAYITSSSGSDWQEIRVRAVETDHDHDDVIRYCKFTSVAWLPDSSGFFYSRFPTPGTVPEEEQMLDNKLYRHTLGTAQDEDALVYERPDTRQLRWPPQISEDGQYIVLHSSGDSLTGNRLYYRLVDSDGDFVRLMDEPDAFYVFIGNSGTTFYLRTTKDAPRGRIIAVDIDNPDPEHWQEIIPQGEDSIEQVEWINNHFVIVSLHDARYQVHLCDLDGQLVREIALPAVGQVETLTGKPHGGDLHLSFESFLHPPAIFRYDFDSDTLTAVGDAAVDPTSGDFETKQIFYPSQDGTRVPMFITYRKGLALNGDNPTILFGYGGFGVTQPTRYYYAWIRTWLEYGGVYAVANLRGGAEYGEEWHQAGMLDKKQNVFDDFIAAAEWLIENGYTRTEKLAIEGRSNGGLLVSACMLQRPDLYGAVLCHVPVTDMLRFHKHTVGRFWTPEYGNAEESKEHFEVLYAYSPLHNIQQGEDYPPILITTADHDDRVVPMHSMKFAARLQAASEGENPILLRVEVKAGHGLGKPTSKLIDERVDVFSFLFDTLEMDS